jgi:hypothetical protein
MGAPTKKFLLFLAVSLLFRGFYLYLFYDRYSYDLVSWKEVGRVLLAGGNPYHVTTFLNWPPVWMQLIYLFEKISQGMNWPLFGVIRGFLIITESIMAGVLYATLLRFGKSKIAEILLIIGIAMNPIAILQVCQHCNFDVLVGLWILLAVHMLLRFQEQGESRFWLWACFALGLGAVTKVIPLCLAPLLLPSLRKLKPSERLLGAALLLVPIVLGLSTLYVLTPSDIETKVLGYRSTPGGFGFSGLFSIFGAEHLQAAWSGVFEIIYGAGWLALGAWLLTRDALQPRQLVSLAAALLLAIPALGPGYGQHYICWFLPLLVLLYDLAGRKMRVFLLVCYAVATITYLVIYALDWVLGAFLLDLTQNEIALKWSKVISSPAGATLLGLPLWMCYLAAVAVFSAPTGVEMLRDFQALWRRR